MSALWIGAVLAGWLGGSILLWRLPMLAAVAPAPATLVGATSVVIPARDEARSLPLLLASLAGQHPAPLEVVVVDDDSQDDTAAIAAANGATVVAAGEVPEGWLGKPWACHRGAEATTGERLVFLDADVQLAPDGLARLVGAQAADPDGLLSVQPYHRVERAYEQLSALANVVPVLASGMARPTRRGAPPWSDVAFGPCLVTTRAVLDAVGGWGAARASVTEDLALARAVRGASRSVRCLGGGAVVSFRMYPDGLRSLVEGWTKNLAAGAGRGPRAFTLVATAWVATLAAVAAAGLAAAGAWLAGGDVPPAPVAVAWTLVSLQLAWMLRRLGSFRWWCSVAFPIPLLAFVALFARSATLHLLRRPVSWRGRRIPPATRPGTT